MNASATSSADRASDEGPRRRLTILVIGAVDSAHVRGRAQALARRGHRVVWASPRPARLEGVEDFLLDPSGPRQLLLRAAGFASKRLGGWSLAPIRSYLELERALETIQPDLIHVHYAYSMLGWLTAAAEKYPLVVSAMGGDILFDEQGAATPLGRWLTLQLLEAADLITAKSNYLIEVLGRLGGFDRKAMRLVWGVDLGTFARRDPTELRREIGLPEKARVILSPKILQPFYNIHLVIDAMAELAPRFPEAMLLITEYAADPEYKARLLGQVERLGLGDRVRFVGCVSADVMPLYYSLAEVAVAVPRSDGLPQALFEAMACEVPNVLGRLPRYLEVVKDRESVVFVDFDAGSIADGIGLVLEDAALVERIRCNARAVVLRDADLDKEVDALEDRIYALMDRPHEKRSAFNRARVLAAASAYSTSQAKRSRFDAVGRVAEWLAERSVERDVAVVPKWSSRRAGRR